MIPNEKILESRTHLSGLPIETIDRLCCVLIDILKEYACSELEDRALKTLLEGDCDRAKHLCLHEPCSDFLAAVSCLASTQRSPLIAESSLRDAARHTSEVAKQTAQKRIAYKFSEILSE